MQPLKVQQNKPGSDKTALAELCRGVQSIFIISRWRGFAFIAGDDVKTDRVIPLRGRLYGLPHFSYKWYMSPKKENRIL